MEACLVGIRLQNMVLQSDLKSQWRLEMAKRRGMCRKPSSAESSKEFCARRELGRESPQFSATRAENCF